MKSNELAIDPTNSSVLSSQSSRAPRYCEAVAIGWRIFWQAVGGFVLLLVASNLVVLGVLPELTRTGPSWWALAFPLVTATGLALLVLMPMVARSLVTQRFRTFWLELVREEASTETERKGKEMLR